MFNAPPPLDFLTVLRRAYAAGVDTILAIGIGAEPYNRMGRALEIANTDYGPGVPRIFASAGIHPEQAHTVSTETLGQMDLLAEDARCIAIGEIGLDYYHVDNPDIATQQKALIAQMEVAAAARKPILIHCRTSELATPAAKKRYGAADAWEDLLGLIDDYWTPCNLGGIMHCFSGTVEQAQRAVAAGFHLSFAGNLTYPKSQSIREAAVAAPADRILVETDCPFLAPVPHRGQLNEPALMTHTAAALAGLRGISPEELARLTTANFGDLFPSTRGHSLT